MEIKFSTLGVTREQIQYSLQECDDIITRCCDILSSDDVQALKRLYKTVAIAPSFDQNLATNTASIVPGVLSPPLIKSSLITASTMNRMYLLMANPISEDKIWRSLMDVVIAENEPLKNKLDMVALRFRRPLSISRI